MPFVKARISVILVLALVASTGTAFSPLHSPFTVRRPSASSHIHHSTKGFGDAPKKRVKGQGQIKREQERSKYDELASTGGQEYNVFVRQFGSDDKSWLVCGAVAVPRGAQVSEAIYANTDALKAAIVRRYKKLAGFEEEFEFGFNLSVYPDDPIEVAVKGGASSKPQGLSIGNWISTLLSPVDTSGTSSPPPPQAPSSRK
jgi:hypothetical protein